MNFRTALKSAACTSFVLCAVVTAPTATISATYTYSVTASGDPTSGPLAGNGGGSNCLRKNKFSGCQRRAAQSARARSPPPIRRRLKRISRKEHAA
jgi:hypothetical protein